MENLRPLSGGPPDPVDGDPVDQCFAGRNLLSSSGSSVFRVLTISEHCQCRICMPKLQAFSAQFETCAAKALKLELRPVYLDQLRRTNDGSLKIKLAIGCVCTLAISSVVEFCFLFHKSVISVSRSE